MGLDSPSLIGHGGDFNPSTIFCGGGGGWMNIFFVENKWTLKKWKLLTG